MQILTLRLFLTVSLYVIASLGVFFQFYSSLVYQDMAYESQSKYIKTLAQLKVDDILGELAQQQKKQVVSFVNSKKFKSAFNKKELSELSLWSKKQFNRYFVTTGMIDLESVFVFNKAYEVLVRENKSDESSPNNCLSIINLMKESKGNERFKPKTIQCQDIQGPLSAVLLPYGGLWPKGYVLFIARSLHNLSQLSSVLNLPIEIRSHENALLFQSKDWQKLYQLGSDENIIRTGFEYKLTSGHTFFQINIAKDNRALALEMQKVRNNLIFLSFCIIFILVFIAGSFQNRAIIPLKSLEKSSKKIIDGVFSPVQGSCIFPEIATPIRSFNLMVETLKKEVAIKERAQQKLVEEKQFSLVTLASIVDAVISLNKEYKITYMNPKAEELSGKEFKECKDIFFDRHFLLYEDPDLRKKLSLKRILSESIQIHQQIIVFFRDQFDNRLELEMSVSKMAGGNKVNESGLVVVFNDVTADRELKRQLSFDALHDSLTGLINRYEFERRALAFLESTYGDKNEHVLMFMDLDQFKIVNDTCGHLAGDELLKQLADTVSQTIRSSDSWARLGGDEFGLLMGNCDLEHAMGHAKQIADIIDNFRFAWEEQVFKIGISIGVVEFGQSGISLSETMSHADSACYLSKNSGSQSIHVYKQDDEGLQEQQGAMNWVSKIHTALEKDRFVLFSQTIKPLNPIDPPHVELLIRYLDNENNYIAPNAFLPAAERYKLSGLIDSWVIEHSFSWIEQNKHQIGDLVIGINLSGISLSDEKFLNFIVHRVKNSPEFSRHICFEITETAVISNIQKAINFMGVLQEMGCQFALDDFGSGLSSFAYLKNFPVDFLKIDGVFIKNIVNSPEDVVLVKAMVSVAHGLGMKTIAEFVEDIESIKLLKELGIDYIQGYGIDKPLELSSLI